ncbi:MAG: LysM peptidoglycan-binding domain-containing protein [Gammaproteobacteria bacterium]|nr:LysM peptidoglycan-binding domain-containing protein [Gammaproteobacteria bacterium]
MNGFLRPALTLASGLIILLLVGCGTDRLKPASLRPQLPSPVEDRVAPTSTAPSTAPKPASTDLWASLQGQFSLGQAQRPEVVREVQWLRANPRWLERLGTTGAPFLQFVASEIAAQKLPGELALLPMLESGYNPTVRSRYGAAGLWQFMAGTGKTFGLTQTPWHDGRLDVTQSTAAAIDYLQTLATRFDGDWLLAIAGYNVGSGALERMLASSARGGARPSVWALPLRRETRQLLARVLAMAEVIRAPARYGIRLPPVDNRPYFARLAVKQPTDLRQFATRIGVPEPEFIRLNAGWRRAHTGPEQPATILIPVAQAAAALALAETLPPSPIPALARAVPPKTAHQAVAEQVHRVRAGESLWTIARHYDLHVEQLARANGLQPKTPLKVGQTMKISGGRPPALAAHTSAHRVAAAQPTAPKAAKTARDSHRITHYRVRAGDTLWTISRQFKVSVDQLLAWNALRRSHALQPGQDLVVHRST